MQDHASPQKMEQDMTPQGAEELARLAKGQRAWDRDNAERLFDENYARVNPRPAGSVNVTQPGA
jgi:hypothetical protein